MNNRSLLLRFTTFAVIVGMACPPLRAADCTCSRERSEHASCCRAADSPAVETQESCCCAGETTSLSKNHTIAGRPSEPPAATEAEATCCCALRAQSLSQNLGMAGLPSEPSAPTGGFHSVFEISPKTKVAATSCQIGDGAQARRNCKCTTRITEHAAPLKPLGAQLVPIRNVVCLLSCVTMSAELRGQVLQPIVVGPPLRILHCVWRN